MKNTLEAGRQLKEIIPMHGVTLKDNKKQIILEGNPY